MSKRSKSKSRSKAKKKPKDKIVVYSSSQKDRLRLYNKRLLQANKGEKVTGRDIALTVMNYEEFYNQFIHVAKNLERKRRKGTLDPELAKLSFFNISDNAVRVYNRHQRTDIKVNVRERTVIAQELYEDYYPEIAEGEYAEYV